MDYWYWCIGGSWGPYALRRRCARGLLDAVSDRSAQLRRPATTKTSSGSGGSFLFWFSRSHPSRNAICGRRAAHFVCLPTANNFRAHQQAGGRAEPSRPGMIIRDIYNRDGVRPRKGRVRLRVGSLLSTLPGTQPYEMVYKRVGFQKRVESSPKGSEV